MSTHDTAGADEPAPDLVANLRLEVRETRPGRWMWELFDARDGTVFERQLEFELASDARNSGVSRLAQLTPSFSGTKMLSRTRETQQSKWLVIVDRQHETLFEELQTLFADTRSVDVIRDRRRADRRRLNRRAAREPATAVRWVERRKKERRSEERRTKTVDAKVQARGWWFVPRSSDEIPVTANSASA
jgi:hypothetical protein